MVGKLIKRIFFGAFFILLPVKPMYAKSVILMIGDGMGFNHILCAAKENHLFLSSMEAASVQTHSSDNKITDSAAAATAYACGVKTKNYRLGLDQSDKPCETIAEKAFNSGKSVYILTTDNQLGATPSAFYTHLKSRYENDKIKQEVTKHQKTFHLQFDIASLQKEIPNLIKHLEEEKQEYFVMIEGAKIDKASHHNDILEMKHQLTDFDAAVEKVWHFAQANNVNLYVTADHETGGLLPSDCHFTTGDHMPFDVPLWVHGDTIDINDEYDNTDIYKMMKRALFQ